MSEILDRTEHDAAVLTSAGFEGLLIENFGDFPFVPDAVEPHVIAAMTRIASHLILSLAKIGRGRIPVFGVNVLRNDARAAVAIATVIGARFVRINVHVGAMITDQGLIEGKAHDTLRYRRLLGSDVSIFADVMVKHAHSIGAEDLVSTARNAFSRGGADALIVSGQATGASTDFSKCQHVRDHVGAPVLVGSGLTIEAMEQALRFADGAIVGTALKENTEVGRPVDGEAALEFVRRRDQLLS